MGGELWILLVLRLGARDFEVWGLGMSWAALRFPIPLRLGAGYME